MIALAKKHADVGIRLYFKKFLSVSIAQLRFLSLILAEAIPIYKICGRLKKNQIAIKPLLIEANTKPLYLKNSASKYYLLYKKKTTKTCSVLVQRQEA